jgi:outer membrane lipoprotein-sorting protein
MITLLSGCAKQTVYDKIHKRFYNMPSYSTICEVTVISNKNKNTYNISAVYDSQNDRYRMDFDDITIVLGKNNAQIKRENKIITTPVTHENMLMLINTFFESYYTGESSVNTSSKISGDITLKCDILNSPEYAKHMELVIDSKTILPKVMSVFNKQNQQIITVKFNNFNILNKIDDNTFKLQ